MSEPWMKSAMDVIWSLPNMGLTREKTRSDAAEEGAIAKMMRAASWCRAGYRNTQETRWYYV